MKIEHRESSLKPSALFAWLLTAFWWGLATGLVEGTGLLLFQRINWRRWGPMVHVSEPIVWISPVVDVGFFLLVALVAWPIARAIRGTPQLRVLIFLLSYLAAYDGLTLTGRLHRFPCQLLALGIACVAGRRVAPREEATAKFFRKNLVAVFALYVVAFSAIQGQRWWSEHSATAALASAPAGARNVLVIVIDTLRADHLSSYGYPLPTTPNLDRIAHEGVLFENAISACSWTFPSHASLLTGRYPSDHGMRNVQPMPWLGWGNKALRGYPTLGEAMERTGYRTGAFSANQQYFTANIGLGRGFFHFDDYFQSVQDMFLRTLYGQEVDRILLRRRESRWITRTLRSLVPSFLDHRKTAAEVNRETLAWIDRGRQPFFAFLNYIDVHDAGAQRWIHAAPPSDTTTFVRQYDANLTYVDSEIGELLRQLDRRGLAKNTLIVITSDHGESLGQHRLQFHGVALYREEIHVPLLILGPASVPAGLRISTPVSNAAIAATVMDLVASDRKTFPGAGLDQLWINPDAAAQWPSPVAELAQNDIGIDPDRAAHSLEPTAVDGDMQSLTTSRWHFIHHQKLGDQLYDWVHDPGELNDLINSAEGKAEASNLAAELQKKSVP